MAGINWATVTTASQQYRSAPYWVGILAPPQALNDDTQGTCLVQTNPRNGAQRRFGFCRRAASNRNQGDGRSGFYIAVGAWIPTHGPQPEVSILRLKSITIAQQRRMQTETSSYSQCMVSGSLIIRPKYVLSAISSAVDPNSVVSIRNPAALQSLRYTTWSPPVSNAAALNPGAAAQPPAGPGNGRNTRVLAHAVNHLLLLPLPHGLRPWYSTRPLSATVNWMILYLNVSGINCFTLAFR